MDMVAEPLQSQRKSNGYVDFNVSQAMWLRQIIEDVYKMHPDADYIPIGFCLGGNSVLQLGPFHEANNPRVLRASGPIVAIAPSTDYIFNKPYQLSADKHYLAAIKSNGYLASDDPEDATWRVIDEQGTAFRVTMGALLDSSPAEALCYPRDMHIDVSAIGISLGAANDTMPLIRQPAFLIAGEADTVSPPPSVADLARKMVRSEVEMAIIQSDHDQMWQEPGVYQPLVRDIITWLERYLL
jgi:pimeloyl-ACP methyl ester carboxylesterase